MPSLQPVEFLSGPWKKMGIDIVEPFAHAPAVAHFAITLIGCFSKWPEVCFIASVTSFNIVSLLRSVFSREGYPEELVSDLGPQFTSAEFKRHLQNRGIKHAFSAVYHPQANGKIELFNRELKAYVQVCLEERRSLAYNSAPHMLQQVKNLLCCCMVVIQNRSWIW